MSDAFKISKEHLFGAWSSVNSQDAVQITSRAGFDFITMDLQHGLNTLNDLAPFVDRAHEGGSGAVVRVPWNAPEYIMRALDLEADYVIVPMIASADDARRAVSYSCYPPAGIRSWGPVKGYVHDLDTTTYIARQKPRVIAMIETVGAVQELAKILAIDNLAGLYIGPGDLGLSHGLGRVSPRHDDALRNIVEGIVSQARAAGLSVGIDCGSVDDARYWLEHGMNYVICTSDSLLLYEASRDFVQRMRGPGHVSSRASYGI